MTDAPIRFLPDTSVLVAACQGQHPRHGSAWTELETRLEDGERMLLATHALVETYSVLTRLPPPLRLSPAMAEGIVRRGFIVNGEVVTLTADEYLGLLDTLAASGVAGGRTYDALIAATAKAAGANVILTFNVRAFAGLGNGIEVRAPASID